MTSQSSLRRNPLAWLVPGALLMLSSAANAQPLAAEPAAEASESTAAPPPAEPAGDVQEPETPAEPAGDVQEPETEPVPLATQPTPVPPLAAPPPSPETPPAPPPSPPPAAPAPEPLKIGASFFSRYEVRSGDLPVIGNRPLNADTLFYRARMSFTPAPLDLGDGFSSTVYFEPQASGAYDVGGNLADIALNLHQGYLHMMAPSYTLDVGRFEMIYGEHLMIGNVGWNQTGRAFNGARVRIAPEANGGWLDLFLTLNDEGNVDGGDAATAGNQNKSIGARDFYFAGAYAGLGPLVGDMDLDLYVLSKIWFGGPGTVQSDPTDPDTATPIHVDPAAQFTVGGRIKGGHGLLDYRLETGAQFGARPGNARPFPVNADPNPVSVVAYQADGEIGVKPITGLRLAAHGFIASGNDPDTDKQEGWDQHFPTAHKFLGLTDVFGGRTNVFGGALHASYAFSTSFKGTLDGHMFFRPEKGAVASDNYVGSEINAGLAYAIGPSLLLRGLYGVFIPGPDGPALLGQQAVSDDPNHFLEIELAQTFK